MSEMSEVKCIGAEELAAMLKEGNVIVVDIRDKSFYGKGHIPGALSINSDQEVSDFLQNTDKAKTVVCCCFHGVSSKKAAAYFQTQGFQDVRSLDGGFDKWKNGQEVEI